MSSIADTSSEEEKEDLVKSDEAARIMSGQVVKEAVNAVLKLPPCQR